MKMEKEIDEYLNWKASYTQKASSNYSLHLKRFSNYTKKDLEKISIADIVNFQLNLKTKYSMANVAYSMIVIKNFFLFYRKQGNACVDPFLIKVPKFTPHSHSTISNEEYEKMLKSLRSDEFWNIQKMVIIKLLFETGMRVSELCDLNISDLDSTIPKALIITKKNNKQRWIFWTEETHKLLMKYLGTRLCLNQKPALFIASRKNRRDRITTRTVQRWVKSICLEAGIERKISLHSFRHAKAHNILDKSGTVKDIQFILGHSENNPISAFSYLRLNSKESEKRAKMFL